MKTVIRFPITSVEALKKLAKRVKKDEGYATLAEAQETLAKHLKFNDWHHVTKTLSGGKPIVDAVAPAPALSGRHTASQRLAVEVLGEHGEVFPRQAILSFFQSSSPQDEKEWMADVLSRRHAVELYRLMGLGDEVVAAAGGDRLVGAVQELLERYWRQYQAFKVIHETYKAACEKDSRLYGYYVHELRDFVAPDGLLLTVDTSNGPMGLSDPAARGLDVSAFREKGAPDLQSRPATAVRTREGPSAGAEANGSSSHIGRAAFENRLREILSRLLASDKYHSLPFAADENLPEKLARVATNAACIYLSPVDEEGNAIDISKTELGNDFSHLALVEIVRSLDAPDIAPAALPGRVYDRIRKAFYLAIG